MYDQATLELIDAAPHFGDLDLEKLPKEFTDIYTNIVTARLKFTEIQDDNKDEELTELYKEISTIAVSYEAYVFLLDERENYASAAFISASAHHLCVQINSFLDIQKTQNVVTLKNSGIDSRIAASILYFISGYTADASEMIKSINIIQEDSSGTRLLLALKQLLTGNIKLVTSNSPLYPAEADWGDEAADNSLWALIHEGINKLLAGLTGHIADSNVAFGEAIEIFDRVLDLSVDDNELVFNNVKITYQPVCVGQFYLTKLLRTLSKILPNIALISIDTPEGIDESHWRNQLINFSSTRPYLWFNHVDAINSGYLNLGISSVVSFPTGGGKSTLSELKIATCLLRAQAVVFIVPTLALVDQVAKSLKTAFPSVTTKMSMEEFGLDDIEIETLPDISVMTPESCLVKMSFNPELYENVGLFVFDECHLLHSKTQDIIDKRSIDSMLCLLRMLDLSPNVDLLLMSAMLSNNEELSSWLSSLIQREVLSLHMNWKPTRQAKGCVVYDSTRIQELYTHIGIAPRAPSGNLTAAAKRGLTAGPFSFFSLNQTWHSNSIADYKLVKLSDNIVTLGVNKFNRLTANRNKVAATLAKDAVSTGLKTLVFATTKKECDSIVKESSVERINGDIHWTEYESNLIDLINIEFGSGDHSYVTKSSSGLQHHGLLLREERLLHESLFRREDGVNLLVATSTLAQGMNLPAEYVIIAGNTRFDVEAGKPEELDAHELLNAAGRAGRAGQNSTGMVIVVPSKVVNFNATTNKITQYWNEIKSVFSQSDQCLVVEDPLGHILDKIHDNPTELSEEVQYFIHRLPVDEASDSTRFISRTFQAYRADLANNQEWVHQRIQVANDAFNRLQNDDELDETWHDQLSSISGIPENLIRQLHIDLVDNIDYLNNIEEIMSWYMKWLGESFDRLSHFIRIQTLEFELGQGFSGLNGPEKCNYFSNQLLNLVNMWISGSTLRDIELAMGTNENTLKVCQKARKFSIRIVPEISYAANILSQVYNFHISNSDDEVEEKLHLKLLGRVVRIGVDNIEKYALHNILKDQAGRVKTKLIYNEIFPAISVIDNPNDFKAVLSEVSGVYMQHKQGLL